MFSLMEANEVTAMTMSDKGALEDRRLFVRNLGVLLSQTREGIIGCVLTDDDIVRVVYNNAYVKEVNVRHDSYMAIVRDVTRNL